MKITSSITNSTSARKRQIERRAGEKPYNKADRYFLGTITNVGTITNASGAAFLNSGTLNNNGTFTNHGTLVNAQTDFAFGTLFNHGTLDNNGTLTNYLNLFNSGTLNNTGTLSNNGTFTNSGIVNITSTGLFTTSTNYTQTDGRTAVNGTLTATGSAIIDIKGGTLSGSGTINGNVITGGTIAPGNSPGILTINGNYTQTAFGVYLAELAGLTAGTGYDQVIVNGTANLHGALDVNLLNGFTVALGDNFILMKYNSETGSFSMVDLPKLSNGLKWDLSYDPGFIDLSVTSGVATTPEPSTYLLWGTVGLLGIGIWARRRFGRELESSV